MIIDRDSSTITTTAGKEVPLDIVAQDNGRLGFKNYLINGGFDIAQRPLPNTDGGYCLDRWQARDVSAVGGTVSINQQQTSLEDNPYIKLTHTNATSTGYILQKIEGLHLAGKTITISAEVNVDTTCDFEASTALYENSAYTTLIGAGKKSIVGGVWTTVSWTVALPSRAASIHTVDDHVYISLGYYGDGVDAVGTNTIRVRQMQVELGSEATAFEQVPYDIELARCQRYLRRTYVSLRGIASSAAQYVAYSQSFEMIDVPTVIATPVSGSTWNLREFTRTITQHGIRYQIQSDAAGSFYVLDRNELLEAEL